VKRLAVPALPAQKVDRIASRPGVRRLADGAEGFVGKESALAVITGERVAGGVHFTFTTDFVTYRTAPAHSHLFPRTSLLCSHLNRSTLICIAYARVTFTTETQRKDGEHRDSVISVDLCVSVVTLSLKPSPRCP